MIIISEILFFKLGEAGADVSKFHVFAEMDYGAKVSDDNTKRDDFNLLEQRLQFKARHNAEGENYFAEKGSVFNFKGDFTVDEYFAGKTFIDSEISLKIKNR